MSAQVSVLRPAVAALRQQPASGDLEQFREAVECWRDAALPANDVEAVRKAEANRLLSIIDNVGVVECSKVSGYIATVPDKCDRIIWRGQYHHLSLHQPAPVVDDAMRELIDAADKAKRAYWLARNSAAGLTNYCEESANSRRCERELGEAERIYRDSGFEAALARAQGVQS